MHLTRLIRAISTILWGHMSGAIVLCCAARAFGQPQQPLLRPPPLLQPDCATAQATLKIVQRLQKTNVLTKFMVPRSSSSAHCSAMLAFLQHPLPPPLPPLSLPPCNLTAASASRHPNACLVSAKTVGVLVQSASRRRAPAATRTEIATSAHMVIR